MTSDEEEMENVDPRNIVNIDASNNTGTQDFNIIQRIEGLTEDDATALFHREMKKFGITKENPLPGTEELSPEKIKRAEEVLEAAKKVKLDATECLMLGQLAMSAGNHSEAESFFTIARKMFKSLGKKRMVAHSIYQIGVSLTHQMKFTESFEMHKQARKEFQKLGDKDMESYVLVDMGNLRLEDGRFEDAKKIYNKILKKMKGYPISEHKAWSGLGIIAQKQGDFPEALKCHNESMSYAMMVMPMDGELALELLSVGSTNLSWIYQEDGELDKALEQLQYGLDCAIKLENIQLMGYALLNIGAMQIEMENFEDAEINLKGARDVFKNTEFYRGKIKVMLNLASLYRTPFSEKYDIESFEEALMSAKELIDLVDYTPEIHSMLNLELAAHNSMQGKGSVESIHDYYWKAIEQAIESGDGYLVSRAVQSALDFFERIEDVGSASRADEMGREFLQSLIHRTK